MNPKLDWQIDRTEMTGYPSVDKPWLKYYSQSAIDSIPFQGNIWENIFKNNMDYPRDIALLYFGKKIRYKKLFDEVDKAACAFTRIGVGQRDVVLLCMPAIPETIYSILALNKLGATANLLNPLFSTDQLKKLIKETKSSVMVVVNELFDKVEEAVDRNQIRHLITVAAVNSLGTIIKCIKRVKPIKDTKSWNKFIKEGVGHLTRTAGYLPEHVAIVVYSSGTSGASKGIQLTNKSVNATICEGENIDFEWERQNIWFNPIPIWFSTSICASVLVPLKNGISVMLEPQYDFSLFQKHIHQFKPNFTISAMGLFEYLRKNCSQNDAYKSFKYAVCGGEYITPHAEQRINDWLINNGATQMLHKGYGMCECGGTVTATAYHCNIPGSAGIPTPHVIVSTFDLKTNKELKYGERGEIRVNTPCSMKSYFKNADATEKFFYTDREGRKWCCTGDMGFVAEDGSVYVSGRLSDSYKDSAGETIYLFDIERAILDCVVVKQCKVVTSRVHNKESHVCHVALESDDKKETIALLLKNQCAEKLPKNHVPHLFKFYEALPVSASGKLDTQRMKTDTSNLIIV